MSFNCLKTRVVVAIQIASIYSNNTFARCFNHTIYFIAESIGIKQGTIAEHLQHAESVIINSWAEQTSASQSPD